MSRTFYCFLWTIASSAVATTLVACNAPKHTHKTASDCAHEMSSGDCFPTSENARADIARTLDRLHASASVADFDVYFSLFTQDAVFIGTDPKERWTLDQFKAYTRPYFTEGKGWTYLPKERHVTMSKHADLAWFDELLWNDKYRFCRGSGVVRKDSDGEWRVEQYVLSFAIANEVAKEATSIGK